VAIPDHNVTPAQLEAIEEAQVAKALKEPESSTPKEPIGVDLQDMAATVLENIQEREYLTGGSE